MSEIEKAFSLINAFATKAQEVAPVVWEKMVFLTQVESIAYLGLGAACAVLSIAFFFAWLKAPLVQVGYDSGNWTFNKILFGCVSLALMLPAAINLFFPWNWIGAFAPEARLIARLIGTLTGTSN